MATRLAQVLQFLNVAGGGGQATLAHSINLNSRQVIPDFLFLDNGAFSIVSCSATAVTVQNDGVGAANLNLCLWRMHTIDRALGGALADLTPQPFVVAGGGGGGGGTPVTAFRYTVTGAEPDLSDFMVPLPVVRADDTYQISGTLAGVANIVGLDFPDIVAGDRTTTHFRLVATSNMTAGDQIDFLIVG